MLFTLLRLVDALAFVAVLCSPLLPASWLLGCGLLLFLKGALFILALDVASFLDMIAGLFLVALAFGFTLTVLKVLVVLYLGQKLVLSFF